MRELEIYVHIPFCVRKCGYCDFLSAPAGAEHQRAYVQALEREIKNFRGKEEYQVSTVFFGGGTPSILPASETGELLELLKQEFAFGSGAEISIECNPGTVSGEKLRAYRRAGFNRISFGLQSADDGELRTLGRIHTWGDFLESYWEARRAGFDNVNVDLMSALPGQTTASWEHTLQRVLELRPEHISAYSLIVEEGTPFYEKYGEDVGLRDRGERSVFLPSEEEEREMYRRTQRLLEEAGLHRYEISNYALPGRECRHNIGYWRGTEYVGFGLGASSLLASARKDVSEVVRTKGNAPEKSEGADSARIGLRYLRRRNPEDMQDYLSGDFSGREELFLSEEDRMAEFMFLGLRMMKGVSEREFERRFGKKMDEVYGNAIRKMQGLGLLCRERGQIALTHRGIDVSNMVMAEFLL